jgi:predicted transcriptional regulator
MVRIGDEFKPGQDVPNSGIYKVLHDAKHAEEHEVTCVYGKKFLPCNHCGEDVRFVLVIAARRVELDKHFKKANHKQNKDRIFYERR